jgi:hypothetical protein
LSDVRSIIFHIPSSSSSSSSSIILILLLLLLLLLHLILLLRRSTFNQLDNKKLLNFSSRRSILFVDNDIKINNGKGIRTKRLGSVFQRRHIKQGR